jgi:hypothetical protein
MDKNSIHKGNIWSKKISKNNHKICSFVFMFAFVFAIVILSFLNIENLSEHIEHRIIKNGLIHDFFQTATDNTYIPMKDDLIVFQHIPRTCGDSIKTHMFSNTTISFQSLDVKGIQSNKIKDIFEDKIEELKKNASVIKGYFSHENLSELSKMIHPRNISVFTILRHPFERLLSLKTFVSPPEIEINQTLEMFIKSRSNDWIQTFFNNSMTKQLGGSWNNDYEKNLALDLNTVLDMAKSNLNNMVFVGFFEFLGDDFDKLHDKVFSHVTSPYVYRWFFNLGTFFTKYRLRVKRYSSKLSSDELNLLKSFCEYDLKLYEWALKKYHPDEKLYDSMFDYFTSLT